MNYLLTQKEFDELSSRSDREKEAERKKLQTVCTMVAEKIQRPHVGFGCVDNNTAEYCDDCAVEDYCPSKHKDYSK